MSKKVLSIILATIMLLSVSTGSLTVNAASKNTVKTSISKIESKAKGFKVTWKKKSKIKGYQIQYSTSSKFKKPSTKTVTKAKTTTATISKLKGCNTKYYVRVRTYKASGSKKIYSSWSKVKKVTTLKHKYSKATCTKAKTCKYCKKISGKALGHNWFAEDRISERFFCLRCCKYGKPDRKQISKAQAYEYLKQWVLRNGTLDIDTGNINYVYRLEEKENSIIGIRTLSGLTYEASSKTLCAWNYMDYENTIDTYSWISLYDYYYYHSSSSLRASGYIDPSTFKYDPYNCPHKYCGVYSALFSLKSLLITKHIPITLSDLGFKVLDS